MALLQNVTARPARTVELTSGRVLQPGEQANADENAPREAALIAAGALAVVDEGGPVPPSSPHSELIFAQIVDIADGDILEWDETAGTWVNAPNAGGSGGGIGEGDLQDAIDRILATIAELHVDDFYPDDVDPAAATAAQDFTALRAAWSAAETLREAGKHALLRLPKRQINPQSSGSSDTAVLTWTPSWASAAGSITLHGEGRACTIRLGSNQKTLMQLQYGSTSAPPTYRNLRMIGFTVDAANQTATVTANYGVVLDAAGRANLYDLWMERVDTINVGTLKVSGIERRNVNLTFFGGNHTSAHAEAVRLTFRDCWFGRSGGGGNYGIIVQAFVSGTQTAQDVYNVTAFGGKSNYWMDDIQVERCRYDSGGTMPGSPDSYSSTGFMFGNSAMGGKLRIRDCHASNSADDGFEINSFYDVVVDGCTATNCPQEGFYFTNLGGMPYPERQTIRVRNCSTFKTDTIGSSTTLYGIGVRGRQDAPHGTVIIDGCRAVGNPETMKGVQALVCRDYIRRIVIRDFHVGSYGSKTFTSSSTFAAFGAPVVIGLMGCKTIVDVDGVYVDQVDEYDFAGFSNEQMQAGAVSISSGADVTVRARRCVLQRRVRTNTGTASGFGSTKRQSVVGIGARSVPNTTDATYALSALTGAGAIGTGSAFAAVAGDLTATDGDADGKYPTSSLNSELSFRHSRVDATDPVTWAAFKTPASMAAAFKAMVAPKVVESAVTGATASQAKPSRSIECYVCDDGTSSFLCVDKVTYDAAGAPTRTSLLGSIVGGAGNVAAINGSAITTAGGAASSYADRGILLASRLTAATPYYVYGAVRDNVITAHVGTSGPSTTTLQPGTAIATTTVTMSDSDARILGDPVTGNPGMGIVATASSARFSGFMAAWRMVVRGTLDGLAQSTPQHGVTGLDHYAVYVLADSNILRIAGLQLRDTDLSRTPHSTHTPVGGADTTQLRGVRIGPGVTLPDGQRVDAPVHPSMVTGSVAGGNSGAAQTVDVGGSDYWLQTHTLTGNCAFTLTGVPKGGTVELLLTQDATGSRVPSFVPPAGGSVKWAGGSAGMTATPGATDLLTLRTLDGVNFIAAGAHDLK
jgi:hypothetical protein